ncbi:MAG TPA: DUF4124 domain-containing protein [Oleiagrimonas sp.]|nr:DUF4124 domain-containing protein [Oleiagrimonas sp.]
MRCIHLSTLMTLLAVSVPTWAGTVYKCVDANGHVSFQDIPCPHGARQHMQHVPDARPAPASPALPSPAPQPPPTPSEPTHTHTPPAQVARVPPPRLFRCIHATDGETYLSRNGRPLPYRAPLGMVGIVPVPLSNQFRHPRGPEVDMSTLIGNNYIWVRDTCRRLPPAVACAALARQNKANDEAIHDAFPDERAPLLEKRKRLHAQMAGCRG